MRAALIILCMLSLGCTNCNKAQNPTSTDYPCGTRMHVCSTAPLSCCWNSLVCGGQPGSGCAADECCYGGDSFAASRDGGAPATQKQWHP